MLLLTHIPWHDRDPTEGFPGPVPCLQRHWEFAQLLALYRQRQPRRVLEVGTYWGGTLYHWLTSAAAGAVVVSIDQPPEGVNQSEFPRWAPDGVDFRMFYGASNDRMLVRAASGFGPFDWIFLDAGHADHEIRADWDTYRALAAPGAVIALHDILPGRHGQSWIQVAPMWKDIQRQGYVTQEIVASEDVDWGGIGVVYL